MYVSILSFTFFLMIDGKIPINDLRTKHSISVGSSEKFYSDLIDDPFVSGVFPKPVISINRTSTNESCKKLSDETFQLDQNFANAIYSYVDSNLSKYNEIACTYLSNNKKVMVEKKSLDYAISVLKYDIKDSQHFKFFTFLYANGKDVEKMFDDFLFYSKLSSLPENDTFSFERLLDYYKLCRKEYVENVENVSNLSDEPVGVEESRNERKWETAPTTYNVADEDYTEYDLVVHVEDYEFLSNALNHVREIPLENNFHTGNNELNAGEENEMKVLNEKFIDDSTTVTEQLGDIKNQIHKVTTAFSGWTPWIDFHGLQKEFNTLISVPISELSSVVYRIVCVVQVTEGVGIQNDIINGWDCNDILVKNNFGFLSIIRNEANNIDKHTSNTEVWCGKSTVNYIKRKRQKLGLNKSSTSSMVSSTPLKLPHMLIWIRQNLNTNNILIGYNILVDTYVLLIGFVSNDLLNGAKYVLYNYCITDFEEQDVTQSINHIDMMNSYLLLFYRLFMQTVDIIAEKLAIDASKNVYVENIESNLSIMIRITDTSNYIRENEYVVLSLMRTAVNNEYGRFIRDFSDTTVTAVKLDLLSKSVEYMKTIKDALSKK